MTEPDAVYKAVLLAKPMFKTLDDDILRQLAEDGIKTNMFSSVYALGNHVIEKASALEAAMKVSLADAVVNADADAGADADAMLATLWNEHADAMLESLSDAGDPEIMAALSEARQMRPSEEMVFTADRGAQQESQLAQLESRLAKLESDLTEAYQRIEEQSKHIVTQRNYITGQNSYIGWLEQFYRNVLQRQIR